MLNILAILISLQVALADKVEPKSLVMKSPKGSHKTFKVKDLGAKTIVRAGLPDLGMSRKKSLCKSPGRIETSNLELVETELELQTLVDDLKMSAKPRELNSDQKAFLAQVPYCKPFLLNLNIISRLLDGWDFVSLE